MQLRDLMATAMLSTDSKGLCCIRLTLNGNS